MYNKKIKKGPHQNKVSRAANQFAEYWFVNFFIILLDRILVCQLVRVYRVPFRQVTLTVCQIAFSEICTRW